LPLLDEEKAELVLYVLDDVRVRESGERERSDERLTEMGGVMVGDSVSVRCAVSDPVSSFVAVRDLDGLG